MSEFGDSFPTLAANLSEALAECEINENVRGINMLGIVLADCSRFALVRAMAFEYRRMGNVQEACRLEKLCEEIYKGFPPEIRW